MGDQMEPASLRIPVEIWWKIFEDVFSLEDLFATTYDGDDWPKDAKKFQFTNIKSFKSAEEQRKILRAVCKSWRDLSDTVGCRFVPLAMYHEDDKWSITDVDSIANTWRLYLGNSTGVHPGLKGMTVQWRVLRITQGNALEIEQVSHPHLRRLDIYLGSQADVPYVPDKFISALKPFANITWLRYVTRSTARDGHCLKDDEGEKIVLPNVEVLHYYGYDGFYLPYYRLSLPSLRHLAIVGEIAADLFPLRRIIAAYGETLHSLHIHTTSSDSGHPEKDDLFPDEDPTYFPHWNYVPHLRDLSL
ncbi:hypothetical protein FRC17_007652, partial [Serendipita sp. 399]